MTPEPRIIEMPAGDPACPRCHGRGVTSAPYLMGLATGDLHTITVCRCAVRREEEDQSHD